MTIDFDHNYLCVDAIRHHARFAADETAVVCGPERLTWAELDHQTRMYASALRTGLNLRHGAPVATLLPNGMDAFIAFWGIIRAGATLVPLNRLVQGPELWGMLDDCKAVAVITDDDGADTLDAAADAGQQPDCRLLTVGRPRTSWESVVDLLAHGDASLPDVTIRPDDLMTVMYSSGTTGTPKGIAHTHLARMWYPWGFGRGLKHDASTVALLATPLCASGTLIHMLPAMYCGGTVVIMPKFDADRAVKLIHTEGVTHTFLVPTQYIAILNSTRQEREDLPTLRVLVTSGQPMAPRTRREVEARFPTASIYEIWGLTEGLATLKTPEDVEHGKGDSVGRPAMLEDIRIIDEAGQEVGPDEHGEIVGHGIGMMTGYHNHAEMTRKSLWTGPSGRDYIRTGDIGFIDDDGYIHLSGRLKDMIKSGGMNIYSVDIENVFMDHPDVEEACAIGVPHEKWVETPYVYIIPVAGADVDPAVLRAWANERLAKYQRVSGVQAIDDFPRTTYGKIKKDILRERILDENPSLETT